MKQRLLLLSLLIILFSQSYAQKFAAIGDYGYAGVSEAAVANLVDSWNVDFIITLGDNNYPLGESSTIDENIGQYYHEYINSYQGTYGSGSSTQKFFPSLGNHDYYTDSAKAYFQYFTLAGNERYYDFVKGDIHFFVLNSDLNEPDGTDSSSVQAQWLKNKISTSASKWNIVYCHNAPYCSDNYHGSHPYMQWPFKGWGADIVLTGHSHVYERVIVNNFPYIVNGLGGASRYSFLTPVAGSVVRYNSDFGALLGQASGDSLNFQFIDITGTQIDSYSLVKTITGVSKRKQNITSFSITPNPSKGKQIVKVNKTLAGEATLRITNELGETIWTQNISFQEGESEIELDLTTYGQGMFYCTITEKDESITEKIVVSK